MAKKVTAIIKLQVNAAKATPAPPIGPALGQHGVNIPGFCKEFNARTQGLEIGTPLPTIITYYQDKSFTFEIKTAPTTWYLKKAAGIQSASKKPGREPAGVVTQAKIREIAEAKLKDLNAVDIDAAMKVIEGSARSMGLRVEG